MNDNQMLPDDGWALALEQASYGTGYEVRKAASDALLADRRARRAEAERLREALALLQRTPILPRCRNTPCDPETCGINALHDDIAAFLKRLAAPAADAGGKAGT